MRNLININLSIKIALLLLINLLHTIAQAQDTSTSKVITTQNAWYYEPWALVIGGIIVILLLVALIRGSKRTTKSRTDNR